MKRLVLILIGLVPLVLFAQIPSINYLRYDSVVIAKVGGTAELVVRNKTKDSLGFLFNIGNGKTQFRRAKQMNDSTLIFGIDTFHVKGSGAAFDSTDIKFTKYLDNNYIDSFNTSYFTTTGGYLDLNVGALPSGGGGPVYWYANTDSLKAYKPADGSVGYTNEYSLGNGGGARYVFFAASTATGNNMTILTPTAGGTGRWFLSPEDGLITYRQVGVFPSSDNTTAGNLASAAVVAAGYHYLGVPANSNYVFDPAGAGIIPRNNLTIYGEDSATSVISAKNYSGQGKFLSVYNDTINKLKNFTFDHLKFVYGQTWNGSGGFGASGPNDTDSHIIAITGGKNISITNCSIQGGGTNCGIYLYSIDTAYVRNNRFTYIGNIAFSTVYSQTNNNFWIENNYFDYFGMYTKYNTAIGRFQNGNDALELGGSRIHIRNNYFRNGADRLWFVMETKLFGYGNDVLSNTFDGNGRNSLGLSYANSEYNPLNLMYNPEIAYNKDINMGYHVHKAKDSLAGQELYLASNLMEHSGIDGLNSHDNYWQGVHYILSRRMLSPSFTDYFDNSGSVGNFESAENILFQLGTVGTDTVKNTTIAGTYVGKDGELLRTFINGDVIQGVTMNLNAKWTGTHIIGEFYSATGGVTPTGININNSTFNGTIGSAFYTQNTTPIVMNFTNNVAPALDTTSNFLTVISGAAPVINKENTRFSSGVFTSHVQKVNGIYPDAAGNVVVSGGSGLSSLGAGLAGTLTVPKLDTNYVHRFPVTAYGAVPDALRIFDGVMTNGSPNLTSATANWTAGDIGKWVRVPGAGAGGLDLVAQIISRTSSTVVVLSVSAGTTVSADTVNYGTDNTAAIQAATYAAGATRGGIVYFPNGKYIVAGALQTSVGGVNPNCIIFIPQVSIGGDAAHNFNNRTTIEFEGESRPTFTPSARLADSLTSREGAAIICLTQGSGNAPAVFGTKPSNGSFSYNNASFRNLQIYVPRNLGGNGPNIGGINCYYSASSMYENVLVGIDGSLFNSVDPTNEVAGIITNQTGSETMTHINNSAVVGFKYGWVTSDHAQGNNQQAYACSYGFVYPLSAYGGGGPKLVGHWLKHYIYIPKSTILGYIPAGQSYINIQNLELEPLDNGTWRQYIDVINDSANYGIGKVTYQFLQNHEADFVRYNGKNVIAEQLSTYGNKVAYNKTEQILGDSNHISTQIKMHYGVGDFYNTAIIPYANNVARIGYINDDGGLYTGTHNGLSGREAYWYDYPSGRAFGSFDGNGAFTVGQNTAAYGARINYPSGTTWGMTIQKSGNTIFGDSTDVPSALVSMKSTTKGFLPPSMTATQMNAISSPVDGLMVYNTTDTSVYYYKRTIGWTSMKGGGGGGGSSQWTTTGSDIYFANKVMIGSTSAPTAPLTILSDIASGRGQFSIQAATGTGATSTSYMSWHDGGGSRMMVEGFGHYAGSSDLNFYYANEINGSYIWRNSAAQIAELTTGGKFGLGRTPTLDVDVLRTQNSGAVIQVENTSTGASAFAGFNAKNNAGSILQMAMNESTNGAFGAVAAGAGYVYSTSTAGLGILSDGPLQFGTSSNLRGSLSTAGVFKLHAYTAPNVVLDTTNYKLAVFASDGTMKESSWQVPGGGTGLVYTNQTIGLFGAASTYTFTYTTPNDGTSHFYTIGGNFVITATGGTLSTTVTYTDPSSNSRNFPFVQQGSTSTAVASGGYTNYPVAGAVAIAPNTVVTYTVITTGTLVATASLAINKLN